MSDEKKDGKKTSDASRRSEPQDNGKQSASGSLQKMSDKEDGTKSFANLSRPQTTDKGKQAHSGSLPKMGGTTGGGTSDDLSQSGVKESPHKDPYASLRLFDTSSTRITVNAKSVLGEATGENLATQAGAATIAGASTKSQATQAAHQRAKNHRGKPAEGKGLLTTTFIRGDAKEKQGKERVEHSVPLRVTTLAMVVLLVMASSTYFGTPLLMTFMLIWLAMFGTLLSYWFREKRPMWVNILPTLGAFGVGAYLVHELTTQLFGGKPYLLPCFASALSGFLALQCFDLRRRIDFGISTLIGLSVLVSTAAVASDWLFVGWILGYVTSISLMFYFDCVSRSKDVGPSRPIGEGRPASMPKPTIRRQARAATSVILIPVLSLPIMTLIVFTFMPRSSSLIDWLLTNVVRPHIAVSRAQRDRGLSAGGLQTGMTPGPGRSNASGTAGGGGGAGGAEDGEAAGKGVNPMDTSTGRSKDSPRGISKGKGEQKPYKESVEKEPQPADYMPAANQLDMIVMRILAPRPAYARRTSFDKYDGKTWERSGPIAEVSFPKDQENLIDVGNANALIIPPECPTVEVKQQITLDMLPPDGMIPAYWAPQTVAGFDSMTVQSDGVLKPDKKPTPGVSYEVLSYLPIYRPQAMRNLPYKKNSEFKRSLFLLPPDEMQKAENELMTKYRQLPEALPERVKAKAKKIAGDEGNWFVRAERISEYLKKHAKYKTKDVHRFQDGDFTDNFLFRSKEGNCAEFATAFTVMARAAGIPARLVAGYLPGKKNKSTGYIEVRIRDGHAWSEIYLPDWGWVPFDATPNGALPEFEKSEGIFSKLADMGLANPFGGAFQKARPRPGAGMGQGIVGSELLKKLTKEKRKKEGKDADDEEDGSFDLMKKLSRMTWEPFVISAILISTAVVAYVFLEQRRIKTALGIPEDARKSTLLFFQVLRDLRKYKIARLPTDTPNDLTVRIHDAFAEHRQSGKFIHPELEPLLTSFMETYSRDRFGRTGVDRVGELESMSEQIKELVSLQK